MFFFFLVSSSVEGGAKMMGAGVGAGEMVGDGVKPRGVGAGVGSGAPGLVVGGGVVGLGVGTPGVGSEQSPLPCQAASQVQVFGAVQVPWPLQ